MPSLINILRLILFEISIASHLRPKLQSIYKTFRQVEIIRCSFSQALVIYFRVTTANVKFKHDLQGNGGIVEQMRVKQAAMKSAFCIHLIVILIFTGTIWAEDSILDPSFHKKDQYPATPESGKRPIAKLDYLQLKASRFLADTAHKIDSYFEDGKRSSKENKSMGTLKFSLGYSRYDRLEVKPRLNLRMRLPRLSRRANLLLEGSDNSDFNVDQNPISRRRTDADNDRGRWRLALGYLLKDRDRFKVSLSAGLSWGYLYSGFKLRTIQHIYNWQGRFGNRFRYYSDDGWENRASYHLERDLSEKYHFRSTAGLNLFEHEKGVPHYQRFSLFQALGPINSMTYETGIYFDTKPSHQVTDLQFLRDWLVIEVSPRVSFPEEHSRRVNPGIVFAFVATFGYNANSEGHKNIFRH